MARRLFLALIVVALASGLASGPGSALSQAPAQPRPPQTSLAIYHDNFALVTERRTLPDDWQKGHNVVRLSDVAATIEPASVHFRSLTDPNASVLSQAFDFDVATNERLLEKSIATKLIVYTRAGQRFEGQLLNYDARQLVLHNEGTLLIVNRGDNIRRIHFAGLPQELQARPTLAWEVQASKPGRHEVELSYLARQIRWRCDYSVTLNHDDSAADLAGWVTIANQSGTTFHDAAVKLLAGEPQLVEAHTPWTSGAEAYRLARQAAAAKPGNDPGRSLGEYKLYQLPKPVTLGHQQIKQVELLTSPGVPVTKNFVYDGARIAGQRGDRQFTPTFGAGEANRKVDVLIELDNRAEKRLGVTLPRGKWRVYKKDRDGGVEFLGEDLLPYSQPGDKVLLAVGQAFDLTGDRKRVSISNVSNRVLEEEYEIRLRSQKSESVTVHVLEKMYRTGEWTILDDKSHDFQQLDPRTVVFPVTVEPGKEVVVTYRVRYQF